MATKEFVVLLLVGLFSCGVIADTCPAEEDLPTGCRCRRYGWYRDDITKTTCYGKQTGSGIEDLKNSLQKSFSGKRSVELEFNGFDKESNIPSRMFEGLDIEELIFKNSSIISWRDENDGLTFVGLENSLKKIKIRNSIQRQKPSNDYEEEKTPLMTLGHLRKLKELDIYKDKIYSLGNDWFGTGGSSIERISLDRCRIDLFGDHAFSTLDNLWIFKSRHNYIETVKRSMFPNPANHLKILDLSYNKIEDLPDDMFTNMPALRSVDLQENRLQTLKESVFRPIWSNLNDLKISFNPIECNEHTEWIFKVERPRGLSGECFIQDEDDPEVYREIDLVDLIEEKQEKGK